ncbi:unnamed protein product [Strongylus vulgaris]|uniref:MSP domain-containing protein n=1 Tax=Strongylus vulgaris TaxID=40348 RepID=A0A3P7KKE9_STRVU|nr:unnamed protein product [Strongylus vulgaris]
METDDFYKIREGPGIDNVTLDPLVNIHEMIFRPLDKLVFNAPFDFDHITYHMTILNNTIHPIAFAIKGKVAPYSLPQYILQKFTIKLRELYSSSHCLSSIWHLEEQAKNSRRYNYAGKTLVCNLIETILVFFNI